MTKTPQSTLRSKILATAVFTSCVLLGGLSAQSQTNTITANDLDALKRDFSTQLENMKSAYEKRITELENQISNIHTQATPTDAALRAENAALKAEQAAAKTEEMYSSTLASKEIQERTAEGERFPWRDLNDYTKGFEFHGMFRSSFGVNGDGGTLKEFQLPLTGGKYTLGNRDDTYGELIFINHFLQDDLKKDNVKFRTEVLIAYATDKATPDGDKKDDKFSAREVFAEAEGICKNHPGMKIWAGQRYYLNPGFQINNADIANFSGYGFGIADLDLPETRWGKLSLAYVGGTFDDLTSDGEVNPTPVYAKNNLVLSLDEVEVPFGHALFWAAIAGAKGRDREFTTTVDGKTVKAPSYASTSGFSVGVVHTAKEFFGGFNQVSAAFGYGAGANLSAVVDKPFNQVNKSWNFMVSESFTIQPRQNISLAFVALAQFARLGDAIATEIVAGDPSKGYKATSNGMKNFKWFSVGIQPVYHFNKYVDVAFEGSIDYTDTDLTGGADGALLKGTVALEFSPDWSFTAKPVMRIFATAASWGDGFTGLVGGDAYKNHQGGYGLGAAVEASW